MYVPKMDTSMLKAIMESIRIILGQCKQDNALCIDVPATTTHLMECLGYNEYFIRRTWKVFEEIDGLRINIYKYHEVAFDILFEHRKEPVPRHRYNCIPVDEEICLRRREECITSPHIHSLYLYLEGRFGRSEYVKINIIRLLRLLQISDEKLAYDLLDEIEELLNGKGSTRRLFTLVLRILVKHRELLRYILPMIPGDSESLLKSSPIARIIHSLIGF